MNSQGNWDDSKPRKPSVFSKGMRKLTRTSSLLNFAAHSDSPRSPSSPNTPKSPTSPKSPYSPKSPKSPVRHELEFQAIGYSTTKDAKMPIHVMHLPTKSESPRKHSFGTASVDRPFEKPVYHNVGDYYRTNSAANSSSASFASLDPKSRTTSFSHDTSNVAAVGLSLAGYGLSTEDLVPPKHVNKRTGLSTIHQNNLSCLVLSESSTKQLPPIPDDFVGSPQLSINTKMRNAPRPSMDSKSLASPMVLGSPIPLANSHLLLSFSAVAMNINQMPDATVVNALFERLLSTRAFDLEATQTLREQHTKRKWELLLRENESNDEFDLKSLLRKTIRTLEDSELDMTTKVLTNSDLESAAPSVSSGFWKSKHKDGNPEVYVQKIFEGRASTKDYKKLLKLLTSKEKGRIPMMWTAEFVKHQGDAALATILTRINRKSIKSNDEFDKEYQIIQCLGELFMQLRASEVSGAHVFVHRHHSRRYHIIKSMMFSMVSPRIGTRHAVTEALTVLAYSDEPDTISMILEAMEALQDYVGDYVRFQPWLGAFESSLDKFFVGDYSRAGYNQTIRSYSVVSLMFLNVLLTKTDDVHKRKAMRNEMLDSRLTPILEKLKVIKDNRIHEEIEKFEAGAEEDYNVLVGADTSQSIGSYEYEDQDLDGVYHQLKQQYMASDVSSEFELKSILSRLVELKTSGKPENIHKVLKLVEASIKNISVEGANVKSPKTESEQVNPSTERLLKEISSLKQENQRLKTYGPDDNLETLKGENLLSADKIVEQERTISSLKQQLALLKDEKLEREQDHKTVSPLKSSFFLPKGKSLMIDELESRLGHKSPEMVSPEMVLTGVMPDAVSIISSSTATKVRNSDSTEHPTDQTLDEDSITTKDSSLGAIHPGSETNPIYIADTSMDSKISLTSRKNPGVLKHGVYAKLKETTSPIIRPPTPPPLWSKSAAPDFIEQNDTIDNSDEFVFEDTTKKADDEIAPPPPPPPPLPSFLQSNDVTSAPSPPPPPPPPPPPVPEFLSKVAGKTPSSLPPPPPPLPPSLNSSTPPSPPPLPPLLSGNNSAIGTPPPPPPPPAIMNSPIGKGLPMSRRVVSDPIRPQKSESPDPKLLIPDIKPKQKLKQMHWDKLDNIEKTFWNDIEHTKFSGELQEKGILEEVERHFAVKSATIKLRKDILGSSTAPEQSKKISLLTRDLAQQFGINLHMFSNVPPEEFVLKVLHCDKDILENVTVLEFFNSDLLSEFNETTLRNFTPYSWKVTNPDSKPKKDPADLERPDRLYLELCFNLRHYWKSRSRALLLVHTFGKDYLDMLRKIKIIDDANTSIRNSESLRSVLGIIRSVGNFMNDDSKKALGFRLGTLQRLKFMKADTNSMHFIHYIEKIVRNTFPEYGAFVDDLNILLHIQNLSIEQIENECQEFDRQINAVSDSVSKGNLSDPTVLHPEDQVLQKVASPLESAKIKNSLLQSHLKKTMTEFQSLMQFYGENPNDNYSRNTFYEKLSTFVTDFKKAHVENVQKEEEQNAAEARKKAVEENKRLREEASANNSEADLTQDEDDDSHSAMDTLLERLRSSGTASGSIKESKSKKKAERRKKALSFYMSVSADQLTTPQDSSGSINEYESVNHLKRRLTQRRNGVNHSSTSVNSDSTLLRTQAMLNKLRQDEAKDQMSVSSE